MKVTGAAEAMVAMVERKSQRLFNSSFFSFLLHGQVLQKFLLLLFRSCGAAACG